MGEDDKFGNGDEQRFIRMPELDALIRANEASQEQTTSSKLDDPNDIASKIVRNSDEEPTPSSSPTTVSSTGNGESLLAEEPTPDLVNDKLDLPELSDGLDIEGSEGNFTEALIESIAALRSDEKRMHRRYPLVSPVLIRDDGAAFFARGTGLDVSETGVSIEVKGQTPAIGQEFTLEFLGSSSLEAFHVSCEVMRVSPVEGKTNHFSVGLKFVKMSKLTQRNLASYLSSQDPN